MVVGKGGDIDAGIFDRHLAAVNVAGVLVTRPDQRARAALESLHSRLLLSYSLLVVIVAKSAGGLTGSYCEISAMGTWESGQQVRKWRKIPPR